MKLPGFTSDNGLAALVSMLPDAERKIVDDVDAIVSMKFSSAFIDYRSPTDEIAPNRPYLHLVGECRAIECDIPYGVDEVVFKPGTGPRVDVFYEFADGELAELVIKGLYWRGFECPAVLCDEMYRVPVACNFKCVEPQNGVPIVFADIIDAHDISVDAEQLGIELGGLFEAIPEQEIVNKEHAPDEYARVMFFEKDMDDISAKIRPGDPSYENAHAGTWADEEYDAALAAESVSAVADADDVSTAYERMRREVDRQLSMQSDDTALQTEAPMEMIEAETVQPQQAGDGQKAKIKPKVVSYTDEQLEDDSEASICG